MAYTKIPSKGVGDAAGIGLLASSVLSLILAAIAIVLRVWVRRMKSRPLALNDWLLFLAWFFSLALTIDIIIFVGWSGLGQQQTHVSPNSITLTFQLLPAAESLWATANTATKVSILLVYKDIFAIQHFRIIINAVIAIVIMLGVGNIIQCLAICRPFAFQWDKTIKDGVCGNQTLGILLVAFLNLFTDLIMVVMPLPLVWNLKMPRTKKLFLMGIFGLGIIICFITILRIVFTFILIRNQQNSTYWIGINAIFLTLEPNLGMVNACLLLLKPLLQHIRPKLGWVSSDQSTPVYPLNSNPRERRGKILSPRYALKNAGTTGTFTRLDDNHEIIGDMSLDTITNRNTNSFQLEEQDTVNFAFDPSYQKHEVTVGQNNTRSSKTSVEGIRVTTTLDMS